MSWMSALRTTIVCVILIVLHYTLRPLIAWDNVDIDFLLIALIFGAVRLRPGLAAVFGLLLGLMADSLALDAFGSSALAMCTVAFAASWLKAVFFADNLVLNGFFLFLGKWVFDLISLIAGHHAQGSALAMQFLVWAPLSALVTATVGVVCLMLLRPLMEVRTA